MKGHIRQRGPNTYLLKFDVGRDPATGRRIQRYKTVHGGVREAQRELSRLLADVAAGAHVDPSKLTVGEYLDKHWLEHVRNQVTAGAFDRYNDIVHKHLTPALGRHRLARLTPAQVQTYYNAALTTGRRVHPAKKAPAGQQARPTTSGLSARTIRLHAKVLSQAMRHAVKLQLIARNPCEAATAPRVEHKEMTALDHDQAAAVIKAAVGTRIYVPVLLALTTGMRRGELLGLRWRDVDLEAGTATVTQALEHTRTGFIFKPPKTDRSRRTIILPDLAIEALRVHKAAQAQKWMRLGLGKDERDLVIAEATTAAAGELVRVPMDPDQLSKAFLRLVKRLGFRCRFHDLRHSHATHLLKSGVHPKVASERLGHASIAITLDTYSHVLPGLQEDAARRVDAALRRALGKE